MRLAGTGKPHSQKAISQLTTITLWRGTLRYFRCPYQTKVMNMLEMVSSAIRPHGEISLLAVVELNEPSRLVEHLAEFELSALRWLGCSVSFATPESGVILHAHSTACAAGGSLPPLCGWEAGCGTPLV
jgi:hypothetical protein